MCDSKSEYTQVPVSEIEDTKKFRWKILFRQSLICFPVWGYYFVMGLSVGAPTVFIPQLRAANVTVSDEEASWLSASLGYASLPWCIVMPLGSEKFGRKWIYFIAGVSQLGSYILFYCSTSVAQILASQWCLGMFASCPVTLSAVVLPEYMIPKYRGFVLTFKSAIFGWGMWVANALGTFFPWKTIAILGICCGVLNLAIIAWWPESPYWLASKRRLAECQRAHRWLKGIDDKSERELKQLIAANQIDPKQESATAKSRWKKLKQAFVCKEFIKPLLLCCLVMSLYHFCGKIAVSVYAIDMLKKITASETRAYSHMLILDGVTVAGMYAGAFLSRYVRRRTILLSATSTGTGCMYLISLYMYLTSQSVLVENDYVSLFLLTLFSLSLSCGPIIMAPSIMAEVIPLKHRGIAIIISAVYTHLLFSTVLKIAPFMFKYFHLHGAFLFYGIISSILIVLIYKFFPETKGMTLCDIMESVKGVREIGPTDVSLTPLASKVVSNERR